MDFEVRTGNTHLEFQGMFMRLPGGVCQGRLHQTSLMKFLPIGGLSSFLIGKMCTRYSPFSVSSILAASMSKSGPKGFNWLALYLPDKEGNYILNCEDFLLLRLNLPVLKLKGLKGG